MRESSSFRLQVLRSSTHLNRTSPLLLPFTRLLFFLVHVGTLPDPEVRKPHTPGALIHTHTYSHAHTHIHNMFSVPTFPCRNSGSGKNKINSITFAIKT